MVPNLRYQVGAAGGGFDFTLDETAHCTQSGTHHVGTHSDSIWVLCDNMSGYV